MSESITVNIVLGVVKTIVCIYDILTLPIYFIFQRPWEKSRLSRQPKASGDPLTGWTRKVGPTDHFLFKCNTINDVVNESVKAYGNQRMLGHREVFAEEDEMQPDGKVFKKLVLGNYVWFSYNEVNKRIDDIARGLMLTGVKPREVVMIFAETRIEWALSANAVFRLGGSIATLYATLGLESIEHGLRETEVTHLITSHDLLPKLRALLPRTSLKHIIYFEGLKQPSLEGFSTVELIPFSKVEENGKTSQNSHSMRFIPPHADDPAIIMYTSGSTGKPKGVIITHRNVVTTIRGFYAVAHSLSRQTNVYIAFLPLAHVLELAAESFFSSIGLSIGYSSPHTMTDKSTGIKKGGIGDATLLKPTVMASVPLVLDRVKKAIMVQVEGRGRFFKSFFEFTMRYKDYWRHRGFQTPIVNFVACRKIRAMLGGKLDYIVTGSAPLSPETHEFIRSCLNATVIQGYGLTETAAGATLMDFDDLSSGRVGPPLLGTPIKLVDWPEGNYHVTDKPYPRGEIVIGGDCATIGYYKNEELTRECYKDEDGTRWFYTGDIGEVHPDGVFKIIDRKKDLVKLQFGEYISLGKVETVLKVCPYVDNICVYGDAYQSYMVALVVPNERALLTLAAQLGKDKLTIPELCRNPEIINAVLKAIQAQGRQGHLNKMEIPGKILICSEEWTPDSGLVTAAFKLRRKELQNYYKSDIKKMYGIQDEKDRVKST